MHSYRSVLTTSDQVVTHHQVILAEVPPKIPNPTNSSSSGPPRLSPLPHCDVSVTKQPQKRKCILEKKENEAYFTAGLLVQAFATDPCSGPLPSRDSPLSLLEVRTGEGRPADGQEGV